MATKRIKEFLATATLQDKIRKIIETYDSVLSVKDKLKPTEIECIQQSIVEDGQVEEFNRTLKALRVVFKNRYRLYFESARLELFNSMLRKELEELEDMLISLAKDNWLIEVIKKDGSTMDDGLKEKLDEIAYSKLKYPRFKFVKTADGFLRINRKEFIKSIEDERRRVRKARQWAKDMHMIYDEYIKLQGIENLIPEDIKETDRLLCSDDFLPDVINYHTKEYYQSSFDEMPDEFADLPDDQVISIGDFLGVELFPKFDDVEVRPEILGENNLFLNELIYDRKSK